MSIDANGWAAIASAIAAAGSVAVAAFSFFQQRENNKNSSIERNIDRLISLATQANNVASQTNANQRKFQQAANLAYALDSAATRIIKLKESSKLSHRDMIGLTGYFLDHLSFVVVEELRTKELPVFEMSGEYDIDDVDYIRYIWLRAANLLLRGEMP
ncbi:hypothetical protein ACOZ2G_000346 [Cronobacter sakazakii]|nr:hypothetical protein [Cronobacter sakazakii]